MKAWQGFVLGFLVMGAVAIAGDRPRVTNVTGGSSTVSGAGGVTSPLNIEALNAGGIDAGPTNIVGQLTQTGSFSLGTGCLTSNASTNTLGCTTVTATSASIGLGTNAQLSLGSGTSSFNVVNRTDYFAAPTITASCTTPTVTWSNGSAEFQFDVGSSCTGVSTAVITFNAAATNGYECKCSNTTAPATRTIDSSAWTTQTVTITNYSRTLGTAADFTDGADIRCICRGG